MDMRIKALHHRGPQPKLKMKTTPFKSFTAPTGAYIERGPRDYQLYASIPHSDALVAVLEMDTDCPGRCFTYFMRGGISESCMSMEECLRGGEAMIELVKAARNQWPRYFQKEAA